MLMQMRKTLRRFLMPALMSLLFVTPAERSDRACAADWPQFLGPDRNGISKETGLIDSWGGGGPKAVASRRSVQGATGRGA